MRLDRFFAGGPPQNCESAILRGDQCDGIALVMGKLSRGKVPGTSELAGFSRRGDGPFDRLCDKYRKRIRERKASDPRAVAFSELSERHP